jgi:hypothetical protein
MVLAFARAGFRVSANPFSDRGGRVSAWMDTPMNMSDEQMPPGEALELELVAQHCFHGR